jgi:uncharacterized protein (DUF433 family)
MKSWIVRNPDVQFGAYVIRGTRIPIRTLRGMFRGGDDKKNLSTTFGIPIEAVEAALNFRRKDMEINNPVGSAEI